MSRPNDNRKSDGGDNGDAVKAMKLCEAAGFLVCGGTLSVKVALRAAGLSRPDAEDEMFRLLDRDCPLYVPSMDHLDRAVVALLSAALDVA